MKKNASRIIAIALVLMMALALIPLGAHAEGTYKVHFESRSSFARGTMADASFQNGKVTLPRCDFHPQGYAFVEWIDLANESRKYANGAVITLEEAGLSETNTVLNLGAVWQEHAPVTVSFAGGGADGGAMSAVSVAYDDIYPIPACGFTRTNYSFAGWKDSEGSSYAVESGHALTADLTLTAQWTQDSVTVALLPGAGSGEASTGSHPKGNDYTVPACGFTAPENQVFDSWMGSDEVSYDPADVISGLAANLTLTAQWKTAGQSSGTSGSSGKTAGAVAAQSHEGLADLEQALNRQATALGFNRQDTRSATYYVWSLWDNNINDKLSADEIRTEAAAGNLDFSVTPPDYLSEVTGPVYAYLFQGGALAPVQYVKIQGAYGFFGSILNPNVGDSPNILVLLALPQSSQPVGNFTFKFDANGGGGNMADVVLPETTPFYAPACAFDAPANKRFAHWCTSADGTTGTVYNPGEMVEKNAEFSQLRLFAIWQDISSSAVALNGSLAVSPAAATVGQTLTATFTATAGNAAGLTYQWMRGVGLIANATASTYTTTEADAGSSIHCEVTDATGTRHFRSNSVNVAAVSKGTPGAAPVSSSSAIPEQVVEGQKRYFGSISGTKTAVYDVTPCWNGDPTKPMSAADIAAALAADTYIPFYLDYPSGTGNGGYSFHVYHYGTDGLKPVHAEDTGRNLLVYGKEFSPFLLMALPTGPADDGVLLTGSPVVNGTLYITWGDSVHPTYFQWTRNGANIAGAAGSSYTSYKVTSADVGYKIACKVTPGTGPVVTSNYVIPTVGINPECTQGVYNDGATDTGVISNVTPDMEYIREEDYIKNPSTAKWTSVTGNSITGLKKGGLYIVRLKASPSVTASVNVPEYYSVRVYEKVKDTRYVDSNGNSAPRHGKLTPTATIVEKGGKVLTITATPNKNYAVYDIEVNGSSVSWSKVGNDYKVSLPNVDRRTNVDVRFVYTGSSPHTGDDSHITLWAELAALSLLGLGAALVVLKKKSRA